MKHARLTGTLQLLDSRSSQRTYEFNGEQPYPHKTNITVLARANEDTNTFIASTDAIEGDEVSIDAVITSAGDILTGVDHILPVSDVHARPGITAIHELAQHHRLG